MSFQTCSLYVFAGTGSPDQKRFPQRASGSREVLCVQRDEKSARFLHTPAHKLPRSQSRQVKAAASN